MGIDTQRVLPVIVSIIIIIMVAILRNYSPRIAAITATMPINIPLTLWIVYAGAPGDQQVRMEFAEGLLIGILPVVAFVLASWILVRSGWSLIPVIVGGYVVWGMGLLVAFVVRRALGA